jgi:hypothetical protein
MKKRDRMKPTALVAMPMQNTAGAVRPSTREMP